jgi:L-lactate dehydrogenase (cytochrome)
VVGAGDGADPVTLSDYISKQFDPGLNWGDLDWFRDRWPGKIVLKGIQTVDDAVIASDHGVDAIALSNHGGRQLDGAPVPLELVAPVVKAVGERLEVYCDGGIRRGSDIVKALALGAHGCMVGRLYLYGLGAAGEPGVDHVLSLLHDGVRRTLALTGCRSISEIGPELISARPGQESRFAEDVVDNQRQSPLVP